LQRQNFIKATGQWREQKKKNNRKATEQKNNQKDEKSEKTKIKKTCAVVG